MRGGSIGIVRERLAEVVVREHFGNFGKNFEMLLSDVVRYEQEYQQLYRLAIRRLEGNRLGKPDERCQWRLETLDASMRHGDAMPEAGGAESLACKQVIGYGGTGDAVVVLKQEAGLLECPLLARHIEVENDVLEREYMAEMCHGAVHKNELRHAL